MKALFFVIFTFLLSAPVSIAQTKESNTMELSAICCSLNAQTSEILNVIATYDNIKKTINVVVENKTEGQLILLNDEHNCSRIYVTCFDSEDNIVYDSWWSFNTSRKFVTLLDKTMKPDFIYDLDTILCQNNKSIKQVNKIKLKFIINYIATNPGVGLKKRGIVKKEIEIKT